MAFRRPEPAACDRANPDHWCVVIDREEVPLNAIQCPSCGEGEGTGQGVDLERMRWTCPTCGHRIAITPASIEE